MRNREISQVHVSSQYVLELHNLCGSVDSEMRVIQDNTIVTFFFITYIMRALRHTPEIFHVTTH